MAQPSGTSIAAPPLEWIGGAYFKSSGES